MNRKYLLLAAAFVSSAFLAPLGAASAAQPVVYVYGPGGPLPAMKQAALVQISEVVVAPLCSG